jgi:predicted small lipoprotein YifL
MARLATVVLAATLAACYSSFDEGGPRGPREPPPREKAPPEKKPVRDKPKKEKKPKQTYAQAWRVICHAKELSGGPDDQVADWIVKNLRNEKARYWFIALGNVKKEDKLAVFLAEAERTGFADCPSTKILFPESKTPASEPTR